jgi:hypothetical protein
VRTVPGHIVSVCKLMGQLLLLHFLKQAIISDYCSFSFFSINQQNTVETLQTTEKV